MWFLLGWLAGRGWRWQTAEEQQRPPRGEDRAGSRSVENMCRPFRDGETFARPASNQQIAMPCS